MMKKSKQSKQSKQSQVSRQSGGPAVVSSSPSRTTNTSANWTVDNWQIPVPVGDCSVHLLLNGNKAIINAFIMDGGKGSDGLTPEEQILRALTAIDKAHQDWTWKFDAWVVTHWDHDHYAGVQTLWIKNPAVTRNNVKLPFRDAYFEEKKPLLYCGGPKPDGIDIPDFNIREPDLEEPGKPTIKNVLLGLDIFTGEHMFNEKGEIPQTTPAQPDQPRFCIVGANGVVAGQPDMVYKKEDPISKNEMSILAVVYWPGKGGGKVSYFTGGDGNPKAETQGLVPFLKNNRNRSTQLPRGTANMVKLDHHGSSNENVNCPDLTKTLLELLKPVNILVTPGNQYGHPTWDVLYYIFDYFKRLRKGAVNGPGKLYTTRSPYWLNTQFGSGVNVAHYRLLGQLFEAHQALGDAGEDEKALHADNTLLRTFAEQQRAMKQTVQEYQREVKGFKADLPIYVPKKPARQQKNVGIGGTKKKKKADEKPYWYVASEVAAYYTKVQTDLATAYETRDNKEEPEAGKFLNALLAIRNFQDLIREILRDLWAKMSDQEIIVAGNPYWLIRFTFDQGGGNTVVCTYDDDGADNKPIDYLTPAEYADPAKLANIQDVNTKRFVRQNINKACLGLSPLDLFKNNLAVFGGDEQLGAMGTNTQRTFNLPARPRKQSADLLGGFTDRFGGFAKAPAQPQDTMSFFDAPSESKGMAEETAPVANPNPNDDDLSDLGALRDLGYHTIPNDGGGLLCGIFALHDSITHQIPTTAIPAGRAPTDEELHHEALYGPAAQLLNTILPNELHTRNFTVDHLASILAQWGQSAGVVEPLQLGIIFQDGSRWRMPVDVVEGGPPPRRVWIEHEGDLLGGGGHYSGIAPGEPDGNRRARVAPKVAKGRMLLEAELRKRARDNLYWRAMMARGEEDLSDPESMGTKTKRLEEEKKKLEEREQASEAATKMFQGWTVEKLKAELTAQGARGLGKLRKAELQKLFVEYEMKKQGLGKLLAADDSEEEACSSGAGSEEDELASGDLESDDEDEDGDVGRFGDNPYRGGIETAELLGRLDGYQFLKQQQKKEQKGKEKRGTTVVSKESDTLLQKRAASGQLKDKKWRGEKKKLKDEKGFGQGPKRGSKRDPEEMEEEEEEDLL
ncbi:hypothetical protein F5144DRAFT_626550 [Chaetomium tenue]|uniref:Uncharacterized protein n=1 Tax=Chaetomium tenue TaxID=1854479 RepID=A0ACB7PH45_9PEZI|nr:hypothetical protein F5144DRAFT_626550 [Chaetomium globosum]